MSPRKIKPHTPLRPPLRPQPSPFAPPPSAVSIWLDYNGDVSVGFPPSPGHVAGHTVILAADEEALSKILLSLLRNRARLSESYLGQASCPTQVMLDTYQKALSAGAKPFREEAELSDFD